jgi:hypothetical protein
MAGRRGYTWLLILGAFLGLAVAVSAAPLSADDDERKALRKQILARKGVDARRWGEDIANPFTNLTETALSRLKAEGVDPDRLVKLRAVLLTGHNHEARFRTFVNRDPNTILVLSEDVDSYHGIYSLGPVLALGGPRRSRYHVIGADLVWFVEGARPSFSTRGLPRWEEPEDAGWRRPADLLKLPASKPATTLAVDDADRKRRTLRERILAAEGEEVAHWGDAIRNPFRSLTAQGRAKLVFRGIDLRRLRKLKTVLLSGEDSTNRRRNFVNADPDTLLVLAEDFATAGNVFSIGPMLIGATGRLSGEVIGADLVWLVERASVQGRITGLPVILDPSVSHAPMQLGGDDVWFGDYGWDRPYDFPTLLPLRLTAGELDALWEDLSGADAWRTARSLRRLVAGGPDFLPYLRQRLRLPPHPSSKRLDRLLDDLDSKEFETRQAATEALGRLGLVIEPELRLVLQSRLTLETRRRVEHILEGVESDKQRFRRALAVLEQLFRPEARTLLENLADGDPDLFLTREARAVLRRMERDR